MKPSDLFFIEMCYRKFAAHGPMAPTLLWPKIQSAGQPWTLAKIKTGTYLLKQLDQAQQLLNTATKSFIKTKSASSSNNEVEAEVVGDDDDEEEWLDVSSDEDATSDSELEDDEDDGNGCKFLSLSKYLNNDAVAQENLQKLELISTDMKNGDLLNIINQYQAAFEGFLYIAKAIQMEKYLEEIQKVSDEIPDQLAKIQSSALYEDFNDGNEDDDEPEEEEEDDSINHNDDDEDDSDSDDEELIHFLSYVMQASHPPENDVDSDLEELFHCMFHCLMNATHPHGGLWN